MYKLGSDCYLCFIHFVLKIKSICKLENTKIINEINLPDITIIQKQEIKSKKFKELLEKDKLYCIEVFDFLFYEINYSEKNNLEKKSLLKDDNLCSCLYKSQFRFKNKSVIIEGINILKKLCVFKNSNNTFFTDLSTFKEQLKLETNESFLSKIKNLDEFYTYVNIEKDKINYNNFYENGFISFLRSAKELKDRTLEKLHNYLENEEILKRDLIRIIESCYDLNNHKIFLFILNFDYLFKFLKWCQVEENFIALLSKEKIKMKSCIMDQFFDKEHESKMVDRNQFLKIINNKLSFIETNIFIFDYYKNTKREEKTLEQTVKEISKDITANINFNNLSFKTSISLFKKIKNDKEEIKNIEIPLSFFEDIRIRVEIILEYSKKIKFNDKKLPLFRSFLEHFDKLKKYYKLIGLAIDSGLRLEDNFFKSILMVDKSNLSDSANPSYLENTYGLISNEDNLLKGKFVFLKNQLSIWDIQKKNLIRNINLKEGNEKLESFFVSFFLDKNLHQTSEKNFNDKFKYIFDCFPERELTQKYLQIIKDSQMKIISKLIVFFSAFIQSVFFKTNIKDSSNHMQFTNLDKLKFKIEKINYLLIKQKKVFKYLVSFCQEIFETNMIKEQSILYCHEEIPWINIERRNNFKVIFRLHSSVDQHSRVQR